MLRNADGGGLRRDVKFSWKKRYEGVKFNVISFMRGWVGVQLIFIFIDTSVFNCTYIIAYE